MLCAIQPDVLVPPQVKAQLVRSFVNVSPVLKYICDVGPIETLDPGLRERTKAAAKLSQNLLTSMKIIWNSEN